MNKDNVVLIDRSDKEIGLREKFKAHKNPVPLHRAISVVIFDRNKKMMLLQKRSKYKKTWPLFWTNTVCTNVRANETYEHAAVRRLKEEMGIVTPLKEVFSFSYKAEYDKTWGEHELDHVFVGRYEGKISADTIEAAGYQWIELTELKKDIKRNSKIYSPWFKIILKKLKI